MLRLAVTNTCLSPLQASWMIGAEGTLGRGGFQATRKPLISFRAAMSIMSLQHAFLMSVWFCIHYANWPNCSSSRCIRNYLSGNETEDEIERKGYLFRRRVQRASYENASYLPDMPPGIKRFKEPTNHIRTSR